MKTNLEYIFTSDLSINDITLTSCGHEQTIIIIEFKNVLDEDYYHIKYDNGKECFKRPSQKVFRVIRVK